MLQEKEYFLKLLNGEVIDKKWWHISFILKEVAEKQVFSWNEFRPFVEKKLKTMDHFDPPAAMPGYLDWCLLYKEELTPEVFIAIERKKQLIEKRIEAKLSKQTTSWRCDNHNAGLRH